MRAMIRLLPLFSLTVLTHSQPEIYHITSTPAHTPSKVIYPGNFLDGPKVKPVNTTTFDWWYFDAVSSSLPSGDHSSVVFTFYDATNSGFEVLNKAKTRLDAQLSGTFRNGTPFLIDAYPSKADGVGSDGRWGKYASWKGSPDARFWQVNFEDAKYGIKGSMTLESVGC